MLIDYLQKIKAKENKPLKTTKILLAATVFIIFIFVFRPENLL